MLTHHRRPVSLSLVSTDLPFWSTVETAATLYEREKDRFHLVLTEPELPKSRGQQSDTPAISPETPQNVRLLWLEISPYRVIMTMQGNKQPSYRHFWEMGVYGISRYWLPHDSLGENQSFRLRNYTRSLVLEGSSLPVYLRVEYELWSDKVQLGRYVLNLDIHH